MLPLHHWSTTLTTILTGTSLCVISPQSQTIVAGQYYHYALDPQIQYTTTILIAHIYRLLSKKNLYIIDEAEDEDKEEEEEEEDGDRQPVWSLKVMCLWGASAKDRLAATFDDMVT
ncbi:hypothetical protein BDR06DRAFT_973932 [Suillus hirtellus]|nr:hypothetical protein BDR06DRAFT_973932 [Suillus hirtellus]